MSQRRGARRSVRLDRRRAEDEGGGRDRRQHAEGGEGPTDRAPPVSGSQLSARSSPTPAPRAPRVTATKRSSGKDRSSLFIKRLQGVEGCNPLANHRGPRSGFRADSALF
jgi:hypothetical protein